MIVPQAGGCAAQGMGASLSRDKVSSPFVIVAEIAGPIVKRTRVLSPAPGMEPARRQPEELQERPQRNARAGLIDGAQDPPLGAPVRQTLSSEAKPGGS